MSHGQSNRGPERAEAPMAGAPPRGQFGEGKIQDQEIYRIAAFRIRESANRIAVLECGARDPELRRVLSAVCDRLLGEERALLALAAKG